MDITLEKIDIVRDRTGVSYKQAKEALESANGNIVDALINIEEAGNKNFSESMSGWTDNISETISVKGTEAIDKVKSLVQSGNVSRIRVKKDDYIIMDIPVTAGAIGAVIMPQITAIGSVVALLTKCTIEVERPNSEVIRVSDSITNTADGIASKIKSVANDIIQAAGSINRKSQDTDIEKQQENIEDYTYKANTDFETTIDINENKYS